MMNQKSCRKLLVAMSIRVVQGRVAFMVSKILVTFGHHHHHEEHQDAAAHQQHDRGVEQVPTIFCRSLAWLSVKSASRRSTASSAPEGSPARTMFT